MSVWCTWNYQALKYWLLDNTFFANLSVLLWPLTGIFLLQINTEKGTPSCAAELKAPDFLWVPGVLQHPTNHRLLWEGRGLPMTSLVPQGRTQAMPGLALGSAAPWPDTNPRLSQILSCWSSCCGAPTTTHVQICVTFRSCFYLSDPSPSVAELGQQTQDLW